VPVLGEWRTVRDALTSAGVMGAEDLGRFVNNTTYVRLSKFDEQAAAPTLLRVLPALKDPRLVTAVAAHLRRPWLRHIDGAYNIVRAA
jgi:hypothetical protein